MKTSGIRTGDILIFADPQFDFTPFAARIGAVIRGTDGDPDKLSVTTYGEEEPEDTYAPADAVIAVLRSQGFVPVTEHDGFSPEIRIV